MTKANWKEAPHDAETYERHEGGFARFCKPGFFCTVGGKWEEKEGSGEWTTLEHRPRIIAWEDMKEGMVVRCVEVKENGNWYRIGELCDVSTDEAGDFGPLNTCGGVTPCPERYTFELVSETEQRKAEREEEVWTHVYGGDKCYIKVTEPDIYGHIVIVTQTDGYVSVCLDDVETIKPTITKAEAEAVSDFARYLGLSNHTFNEYIEKYNVK